MKRSSLLEFYLVDDPLPHVGHALQGRHQIRGTVDSVVRLRIHCINCDDGLKVMEIIFLVRLSVSKA